MRCVHYQFRGDCFVFPWFNGSGAILNLIYVVILINGFLLLFHLILETLHTLFKFCSFDAFDRIFFFPTSKKNVKLLDDYISSWVIVAIFSSDCLIDMHGVGYMNYDHWVTFSLKDKCKCKCLGNCLFDLLLLNSLVWWQETLIISSPNVLYFINLI